MEEYQNLFIILVLGGWFNTTVKCFILISANTTWDHSLVIIDFLQPRAITTTNSNEIKSVSYYVECTIKNITIATKLPLLLAILLLYSEFLKRLGVSCYHMIEICDCQLLLNSTENWIYDQHSSLHLLKTLAHNHHPCVLPSIRTKFFATNPKCKGFSPKFYMANWLIWKPVLVVMHVQLLHPGSTPSNILLDQVSRRWRNMTYFLYTSISEVNYCSSWWLYASYLWDNSSEPD